MKLVSLTAAFKIDLCFDDENAPIMEYLHKLEGANRCILRSADDFNEVPVEEIGLAFILVSNLVKDYLENPSSPDPEMIKILVNSIEKNSVH